MSCICQCNCFGCRAAHPAAPPAPPIVATINVAAGVYPQFAAIVLNPAGCAAAPAPIVWRFGW